MKKTYSTPVMYREAYIAEQYVAASDCGKHVGTPQHGHVQLKDDLFHCAFTSSNCGEKASSCLAGQTGTSHSDITGKHVVITNENGTVDTSSFKDGRPTAGHNCHILSSNAAAQAFVSTYRDDVCAAGVAELMNLNSFEEIATAFS